jgi:hypothetical protein
MVTTHEDHVQHTTLTWKPTPVGGWLVPSVGIVTEGTGDVGTWSPNWPSGGSPPQPLTFQSLLAGAPATSA